VALAGLLCFLLGFRWIGAGIAVGAGLALINGLLLSRRVEAAADTGDMARAMLIMQLGLLVTFTVVAIATVILVQISVVMTIGSAVGFAVTHLAMLASFYWTRARASVAMEETT
jgi:hypothetical protein